MVWSIMHEKDVVTGISVCFSCQAFKVTNVKEEVGYPLLCKIQCRTLKLSGQRKITVSCGYVLNSYFCQASSIHWNFIH